MGKRLAWLLTIFGTWLEGIGKACGDDESRYWEHERKALENFLGLFQ